MADSSKVRLFVALGILALFGIATLALAAATLATLNKQYKDLKNSINLSTTRPLTNSVLADSIRAEDLMKHLNELQRFASNSGNTRAIGTRGFEETVNYIDNYLTDNAPTLNVFRKELPVRNFTIQLI